MMTRLSVWAAAFAVTISQAIAAGTETEIDRLMQALGFEQTIEIMQEEGLKYGAEVAQDMLPGADPDAWAGTVARIHDTGKMLTLIRRDFRAELADADLEPMLVFFESEAGQRIIESEIAARRAFLDPDVVDAATDSYRDAAGGDSWLVDQVHRIIDDSDLVEFNVMGALNSNLMFYRGLKDGGVYDVTEDEILADVWATEDDMRQDSVEWLGAFLTLAYQPLEEAQVESYAAFYRTAAGRELNRAIFAAFDRMYEELSYLLGLAVAEHMKSEPL